MTDRNTEFYILMRGMNMKIVIYYSLAVSNFYSIITDIDTLHFLVLPPKKS